MALWRPEIPAQQLVERPFEQPVDRLNNCWSYILFDRMDRLTGGWRIAMSGQIGWTATCFFFNSTTSALRRPASSRCDRPSPFESYTCFVCLYSRARPARACPVLTRSAPPPPAPPKRPHMSRPGPLYPRTLRPHSLDHGATGPLTPCDASNMGLAWWLQEGSTSDTNSYHTSRARACVCASATDRRGRRTGGGRRSCPRITRRAGTHSLWPPARRRHPRTAAAEPKSSGG
jgi:hypothetical protein